MVYCGGKLIENLKSFYKSNRYHTWDVGRTLEKLVNHSPSACDLQAFLVFSQHLAYVGYHAGKPIESVVYCLNGSQAPGREDSHMKMTGPEYSPCA